MAKHGWSQLSMLERYQHVTDALLEEAAQRVTPPLPRNYRSLADGDGGLWPPRADYESVSNPTVGGSSPPGGTRY